MARAQINITDKEWRRIVALPSVRAALRAKAQGIAARARGIAASEQLDTTVEVSEGVRPKGRTYARVASDDAEGEFGTQIKARHAMLRRSISG